MATLHDTRKRRSMAARVACEIIIKVGVCIKVEDIDRSVSFHNGRNERDRYGVITANTDRRRLRQMGSTDRRKDQPVVARALFSERQITLIDQGDVLANFHAVLASEIAAVTPQRRTDSRRAASSATFKGAVDVCWQPEQVDR